MKKILLSCISCTCFLLSFAQMEDSYLKVTYKGYVNGTYQVEVTNKQHCTSNIEFQFENVTITKVVSNKNNTLTQNMIGKNETAIYSFTGAYSPNFKISVRALTICEWHDFSPVWLVSVNNLQSVLPMKMNEIKTRKVDDDIIELSFTVYEQANVNRFNVQVSPDGKTFKTVSVILPAQIKPNQLYKANIQL